jgi:hypothetical protein
LSAHQSVRAESLVDRLVQQDLSKALPLISTMPNLTRQIAAALGRAAVRDGGAHLAAWADLLAGDDASAELYTAFGENADLTMLPALEKAGPEAMSAFAKRWATSDLAACQRWAQQHTNLLDTVVPLAAKRDPQQALAWIATLPSTSDQATARGHVYPAWAARDPSAALAAIYADGSPQAVSASINEIGKALASQPPVRVLQALVANPEAAMMKGDRWGSGTGASIAGQWLKEYVSQSAVESVTILTQLSEASLRHDLIAKAAYHWDDHGSPELIQSLSEAATNEPSGETHNALAQALISTSIKLGDAETAFKWLEDQQTSPRYQTNVGAAVEAFVNLAPAQLAQHWELLPSKVQSEIRSKLLDQWTQVDANAAQRWQAAHPLTEAAKAASSAE